MLIASDIHANPGSSILPNMRLATSKVRSVKHKSASITDLVISKKLDILTLTETWLSPHETTSSISAISPLTVPFTTNQVTLDVGVVLAFWSPKNVKSHSVQIYSRLITVHLLVTCVSIVLLE